MLVTTAPITTSILRDDSVSSTVFFMVHFQPVMMEGWILLVVGLGSYTAFEMGSPHSIVANMLDSTTIVSSNSSYTSVYFQTNTIGNTNNVLNRITAVLLQECLWHKITHEGQYAIKQRRATFEGVVPY